MSSLDSAPASSGAILLTLTYGDPATPTIRRYCRWTSNIVLGSETFLSEPTLEVELGKKTGDTEDIPTKFTMFHEREPLNRLVQPFRHSPVRVKIEEINPFDIASRATLYVGSVDFVRKNPNGRRGMLAEVTCFGVKSRLSKFQISLPMNSNCDNRFGGPRCGADPTPWIRTGIVVSVGSPLRNTVVLNLTGVTNPVTDLPHNRYQNGAVVVDGLSIPIRRSLADGSFELANIPPPWWVDSACTIKPGCNHQLVACRVWGREISFNGRGCKIPARNPVFEVPST